MSTTYSFYRSLQPNDPHAYPIALDLTAPTFTDDAVLPGVQYWYRYSKTVDGGQPVFSADVSAIEPFPPSPAPKGSQMSRRIFSTGQLFFDIGSGPQELAVLQDIEYALTFQDKALYTAPWLGTHARTRAYYGGEMKMKATNAVFSAAACVALTGAASIAPVAANPGAVPPVAGSPGIVRLTGTAALPRFSGQFTTQDESGNPVVVTCGNVRAPGMTIPYKLDDFAMPNFSMIADPDSNGNVAIWTFVN